jgi:hypothetical protein
MKKSVRSYLLKTVAATVIICASLPGAKAQMKYEIGISAGPSNFLGDLGGNFGKGQKFIKDNNIELTRIMPGIYFSVIPSEWFNVRGQFQLWQTGRR